jgi:hypothetical protein
VCIVILVFRIAKPEKQRFKEKQFKEIVNTTIIIVVVVMAQVLRSIFPEEVMDHIAALMPEDHRIEWETLYGATLIYRTKHFLTYGGGPEGGYVIFIGNASRGGMNGTETGEPWLPTQR